MKLSKELVLRAVTAAFELNTENNHAKATASYSDDALTLGVICCKKGGWVYYKVSTANHTGDQIYADSHEENLAGFLAALQEISK